MKVARILYKSLNLDYFDLVFRYYPIVQHIRKSGISSPKILEAGPGPVGIAPFLNRMVFTVDLKFFPEPHPLMTPVIGSVTDLPFPDRMFDFVVSVDMLEHLPMEIRRRAIGELLRVCRNEAIVALPCDDITARYEFEMNEEHKKYLYEENVFLKEHIEHGLCSTNEMKMILSDVADARWHHHKIKMLNNVNLDIWYLVRKFNLIMRSHLGTPDVRKEFSPLFCWCFNKIIHWSPAYRRIFFISES